MSLEGVLAFDGLPHLVAIRHQNGVVGEWRGDAELCEEAGEGFPSGSKRFRGRSGRHVFLENLGQTVLEQQAAVVLFEQEVLPAAALNDLLIFELDAHPLQHAQILLPGLFQCLVGRNLMEPLIEWPSRQMACAEESMSV